MKQRLKNLAKVGNIACFAILYILTTYLVFFVARFAPGQTVSIIAFCLVAVASMLIAYKYASKRLNALLFFLITTILFLVCFLLPPDEFLTSPYHIANPYFYLFMILLATVHSALLTYIWKCTIKKTTAIQNPIFIYGLAYALFHFVLSPIISPYTSNSTHVAVGMYLARTIGVNIFYWDYSGYVGLIYIFSILGAVVVVVFTLRLIDKFSHSNK